MPHTPPPTPPAFILLTPINQSPNRGFGMDKAVSDRRWSLGDWLTGFQDRNVIIRSAERE